LNTKESDWLKKNIKEHVIGRFDVIDAGCGGHKYLSKPQHRSLYMFLEQEVGHVTSVGFDGSDIIYDLTSSSLTQRIFRESGLVLLLNVLEHVRPADRSVVLHNVDSMLESGYIIISAPHKMPWHPRPIDTLYRPNATELTGDVINILPHLVYIHGETYNQGWQNWKQKLFQPFVEPEQTDIIFKK
jgi:hypothetical protein